MSLALPRSAADLQSLVAQQVPESLHLDYKASQALNNKDEISKDVSAFLNSDGGHIVYGIVEANQLPIRVDGGVEHASFTRERLEQIVLSNIAPRPSGIEVVSIPLSATHSAYAVGIPRSFRGPHQDAKTAKYYKRFEFQSVPMQHFEIEDVRARRSLLEPLVSVDVEIQQGLLVHIVVENIGTLPAQDVTFLFEPTLPWHRSGEPPPFLARGTKYLPPKRKYHFLYDSYLELTKEGATKPTVFSVTARYRHPLADSPVDEVFYFDLTDYYSASIVKSDTARAADEIKEALRNVTRQLETLSGHLEGLSAIAGATGLSLSLPTLRNLKGIAAGSLDEMHVDSRQWTPDAFEEALGVDTHMARQLCLHTRRGDTKELEGIPGMTPALAERVRKLLAGVVGA